MPSGTAQSQDYMLKQKLEGGNKSFFKSIKFG